MIYTEPVWKSLIVTTINPMFTPQECQAIIKKGLSLPPAEANIGIEKKENEKKEEEITQRVDEKIRKSTISWIPFPEMPEMYQIIEQTIGRANNNQFNFDGIVMGEPAQFTEYKEDGGHYNWHMDIETIGVNEPPIRKISMTVPLVPETDFEGGQMEFNKPGDVLHLKQGQAVFFASFLQHRVLPVTRGTRYSLVQWFTGPPFK